MYLSNKRFTNNASRHFTSVSIAPAVAVVSLENTALPSSVYSTIPDAARAHPVNCALLYPLPD